MADKPTACKQTNKQTNKYINKYSLPRRQPSRKIAGVACQKETCLICSAGLCLSK